MNFGNVQLASVVSQYTLASTAVPPQRTFEMCIIFCIERFTFVPQRGSLLLGAVHYFGADDNDVEKEQKEHPAHFINIRGSLLLIESALLRVGKLSCSSLDRVEKVHFQFSGLY